MLAIRLNGLEAAHFAEFLHRELSPWLTGPAVL
jgi:hypothetical protein